MQMVLGERTTMCHTIGSWNQGTSTWYTRYEGSEEIVFDETSLSALHERHYY